MYSVLRSERPQARSSGLSLMSTFSGVTSPTQATKRSQTLCAAFTEICWPTMDDESIIEELVEVRGIGRWTAEMFLIFNLLRPDVLPLDDLGLQRAICLHYFKGRARSRRTMAKLAGAWAPWRSVATWYLWRSLDPLPVEY